MKMKSIDKDVEKKARRRINRFIKTGQPVARVEETDDVNVFEYKSKHHVSSLLFKRDRIGRLRLMNQQTNKLNM